VADEDVDEVDAASLALETELSPVADVDRETLENGIVVVEVTPRNPDALAVTWIHLGSEIVFQAGRHGGRWELARTSEDVAFMRRLVQGIVAGRVRETFGPRRSQVQVTLSDGTTVTETGQMGCLPIPGWKRRGSTVEYAAHASP